MRTLHLLVAGIASLAVAGCTLKFANEAPVCGTLQKEYRFPMPRDVPDRQDETFVCLAFSGGGARAAALAYGVLRGLDSISLPPTDAMPTRSLLDEVDLISATSGGSFTALAYAVWGKKALEEDGKFKRLYLKRDAELDLALLFGVRMLLSPIRTDFLARYLSEHVFENIQYAGLRYDKNGPARPFVVVNATNLGNGMRFRFTQDYFDLIGSDLSALPVGYAAAASSAYPILLSDVRFRYYDNDLSKTAYKRILSQYETAPEKPELYRWARTVSVCYDVAPKEARFDHDNHSVLHLVDGGLGDYTGLAFIVESLTDRKNGIIARRLDGPIRHLAVILVDGSNDLSKRYESPQRIPEFDEIIEARGGSPVMNNAAVLTLALQGLLSGIEGSGCRTYFATIELCKARPSKERDRIIQDVDRLSLPSADIEWLIEEGKRQIQEDTQVKDLVAGLTNSPARRTAESRDGADAVTAAPKLRK